MKRRLLALPLLVLAGPLSAAALAWLAGRDVPAPLPEDEALWRAALGEKGAERAFGGWVEALSGIPGRDRRAEAAEPLSGFGRRMIAGVQAAQEEWSRLGEDVAGSPLAAPAVVYMGGIDDGYEAGAGAAASRSDVPRLALWDTLSEALPESPAGPDRTGAIALRRGDPVRAWADLSEALARGGRTPDAFLRRGLAAHALGDHEAANRDAQAALALAPANAAALKLAEMTRGLRSSVRLPPAPHRPLRREGEQMRRDGEQMRRDGEQMRRQGEQMRREGEQMRREDSPTPPEGGSWGGPERPARKSMRWVYAGAGVLLLAGLLLALRRAGSS